MRLLKLFCNALVAWALGLAFIAATLYFTNDGVDFTTTDLMGFGVMAVVASGLLMLVLYLPSLYWLRRRRGARVLAAQHLQCPGELFRTNLDEL